MNMVVDYVNWIDIYIYNINECKECVEVATLRRRTARGDISHTS